MEQKEIMFPKIYNDDKHFHPISLEQDFMKYDIDDLLYGFMIYHTTYDPTTKEYYLTERKWTQIRPLFCRGTAMTAQTCGVPLKIGIEDNSLSEFLEGIMNAKNEDELRIFARQSIYSDVRNPSKELIKTFEQHLNKADFELFKKAVCTPKKPSNPVTPVYTALSKKSKHITSNKIAPNSECPCGSGKKYKKCCGLK